MNITSFGIVYKAQILISTSSTATIKCHSRSEITYEQQPLNIHQRRPPLALYQRIDIPLIAVWSQLRMSAIMITTTVHISSRKGCCLKQNITYKVSSSDKTFVLCIGDSPSKVSNSSFSLASVPSRLWLEDSNSFKLFAKANFSRSSDIIDAPCSLFAESATAASVDCLLIPTVRDNARLVCRKKC